MKRKFDLFDPQPRYEQIRGARYWPDTMFVDMSNYPEEWQQFDGNEYQLLRDGDLNLFVAAAARMHEQVHWLQTIGTTFGRFLALNRITTGDLAEAALTTASKNEIERLAKVRANGIAPASRNKQGRLLHEVEYSLTIQSLLDHWWATVALEHYLVDGNYSLINPVDPRFLVGLGMRYVDAGERFRIVFNSPDKDFLEETRSYGPLGGTKPPKPHNALTTRHIEEGAALIVQHIFLSRVSASLSDSRAQLLGQRALAWTLERFIDRRYSLYARAFFEFLAVLPDHCLNRQLELFLLVCDIALNPEISFDRTSQHTWSDFLPVLRFFSILRVMRIQSLDCLVNEDMPLSDWWTRQRDQFVHLAGLSDGARNPTMIAKPKNWVDPYGKPTEYMRQFVLWAGANLEALRSKFPAAACSPANVVGPDESAFIAEFGQQEGPTYDPPLLIKNHGFGEPVSISTEIFVSLITAATCKRSIHSWLAHSGAISFDGLPSDKAGRLAQERALHRMSLLFDVTAK